MPLVKNPVVNVTGANLHYSESVGSLNYYLREVRKYEQLSPSEEKALFERIKAGDEKAKNELIEANQLFVLAVAKRYTAGDNIMDLVQVGNIGMLQAIEKFNPEWKGPDGNNIRFLSYAAWYIRREICAYLVNDTLIRRTNNVKTVYKINRVKNNFFLENGRYPSLDELKDIIENEYKIKIKDMSYLYDVETKYINQAYDSDDKRDTFERSALFNEKSADYNEYDPQIDADHNKHVTNVLLESLGDREREIVKLLFGIDCDREYTLEEVAQKFGMTRERIRQIKKASMNKLKRVYATHDIK